MRALTLLQILQAKFDMPTAPEDWSYRLHFEGWQSTYAQSFPGTRTVPDNLTCPCRHDDWFAADLLMPYEVQEPEPPPEDDGFSLPPPDDGFGLPPSPAPQKSCAIS